MVETPSNGKALVPSSTSRTALTELPMIASDLRTSIRLRVARAKDRVLAAERTAHAAVEHYEKYADAIEAEAAAVVADLGAGSNSPLTSSEPASSERKDGTAN